MLYGSEHHHDYSPRWGSTPLWAKLCATAAFVTVAVIIGRFW